MKLTLEEKEQIVRDHYSKAYRIRVKSHLTPEEIEEYYHYIIELHRSEQEHIEKSKAKGILKLLI